MNHMNYRPVRGKASPYKGVVPTAKPNRWRAELYLPNNQRIRLGPFDSEIEAALAYDEAREALLRDPANAALTELLASNYRQKIGLLRRMTQLAS